MLPSLWFTLGMTKGSRQQAAKAKTCRSVPEDLLDPNDMECSLCMRSDHELHAQHEVNTPAHIVHLKKNQ